MQNAGRGQARYFGGGRPYRGGRGRGGGGRHRGGRGNHHQWRGGGGRHPNNHFGARGGRRGGGGRHGGGGGGGNRGPVKPLIDRDTTVIEEILCNQNNNNDSSSMSSSSIRVAIEGCCHGELEAIYARLQRHEQETTAAEAAAIATSNEDDENNSSDHKNNNSNKIDLLICCGDFESLRNLADLHTIAVPPKYRTMGSFYKYYSGELVAPYLTIFVGGNHEASQALHELYYGGWVAPRIYYLGAAGVVNLGSGGLRIGGASGIYKSHDFRHGRYERPPYNSSTLRSVYHVRNVDIYRLSCLQQQQQQQQQQDADNDKNDTDHSSSSSAPATTTAARLDVMISHDWPQGVEQHGDTATLIRRKPHFEREIQQNCLGSPPNWQLLQQLKPRWWFAAHLHCKFRAQVVHNKGNIGNDDSRNGEATGETDNNGNKNNNNNGGNVTDLIPSSTIQGETPRKRKAEASPPAVKEEDDDIKVVATDSGPEHSKGEATDTATAPTIDDDNEPSSPTTPAATPTSEPDKNDSNNTTNFVAPSQTFQSCKGGPPDLTELMTQFLSLDKCLPRRHFLTVVNIPVASRPETLELEYDVEWLAILRKTHHLSSTSPNPVRMPERPSFVDEAEQEWVRQRLGSSLVIPDNFVRTVPAIPPGSEMDPPPRALPPPIAGPMGNPQTDQLLQLLELDHIVTVPYDEPKANDTRTLVSEPSSQVAAAATATAPAASTADDNEIDLDDDDAGDTLFHQPQQELSEGNAADDNEIDLDEDE